MFLHGIWRAHQLRQGDDPLDPASRTALPSFQDSVTCQSGFCHTLNGAVLGNYLYVAFQSLPMVRWDLTSRPKSWKQVFIGVDSIINNELTPTALTTTSQSTLFAATSDGLYKSEDGILGRAYQTKLARYATSHH